MGQMLMQKKAEATEEETAPAGGKVLQNKRADAASKAVLPDKRTVQKRQNHTGMPDKLKAGVEALSGMSMDHVRVHYNSDKPAQLQAHAYAQGHQIHLAPGQEKHLPHEAWHVVQQAQGRVSPTMQMKAGVVVNEDKGLEREADVKGRKAVQMVGGENRGQAPISIISHQLPGESPGAQFIRCVPIQCALDNKILVGQSHRKDDTGTVAKAVVAYNQNILAKTIKQKVSELNALLALLLKWFDTNKKGDLDEMPIAKTMKQMLNNVQIEHEKVVAESLKQNDDIPVAGFDALPKHMQEEVRNIWQKLVNNSGNIVINDIADGFKGEVLAAFARLLETAFGRSLLIRANQDTKGKKQIRISPGLALQPRSGESTANEFLATPLLQEEATLSEASQAELFGQKKKGSNAWKRKRNELKKDYPTLAISADATEEERIALIHDAPQRFAGKKGYSINVEGQLRYFRFNVGTGAEIVFTRDIRDSTDHATSRFIDTQRNEIIVPVFVTLAHELGHAIHFLEGNAVDGLTDVLGKIVAPGENFHEWSNLEEYQTIKGVENNVRKDIGATERFSHHNFLSYTANQIRHGALQAAYDTAKKLEEPARTNVYKLLDQVGPLLAERKLKTARQRLKKAEKQIRIVLAQLEEQQNPAPHQQLQPQQKTQPWINFWPFK